MSEAYIGGMNRKEYTFLAVCMAIIAVIFYWLDLYRDYDPRELIIPILVVIGVLIYQRVRRRRVPPS